MHVESLPFNCNRTIRLLRGLAFAGMMLVSGLAVAFPATYGQAHRVTGQVSSINEAAGLPGASVTLKGTTTGVVTDVDGRYQIDLPSGEVVLVFSYIGFTTQEVSVSNRNVVDVQLLPDTETLQEIVVVGYGTQEKINLTGAVGVIGDKELQNRAVGSVMEAMQGQVAGLNIVRTSAQPGNQAINFNIRGSSTFTSNPVLTIVDGVPSALENINPNDIESISVLKDAASAAIYGSRATGGVVIITTKSGRSGKPQLSYNSTFSLQQPTRWPEKPGAFDYATIHNVASVNDGTAPRYTPADLERFSSPDWQDHDWDGYLMGNAFQTNQNLSVRGGTESHDYYISLGYLKQDGVVINTGFERLNLQMNQNVRVGKKLELGVKAGYAPSIITAPAYDWSQLRFIYSTPKTEPFRSEDGKWLQEASHTTQGNALAGLSEDAGQELTWEKRLTGNFHATYSLLENLKVTGTYGIVSNNARRRNYRKILTVYDAKNPDIVAVKSVDNYLTIDNARDAFQNISLIANYNKSFGDHSVALLGGVTREWFEEGNELVGTRSFLTEGIYVIAAGSSNPEFRTVSGAAGDYALQSYIARLNYSFKEKYLLEATFRNDGSSRFAEDVR